MNVIFKYPLELTGLQQIEMPADARILHVGMQRDIPTLWALVEPNAQETTRGFHIVGTGHEASPSWTHLGTCLTSDHQFAWHIFED